MASNFTGGLSRKISGKSYHDFHEWPDYSTSAPAWAESCERFTMVSQVAFE
jgi:hypothetical protein